MNFVVIRQLSLHAFCSIKTVVFYKHTPIVGTLCHHRCPRVEFIHLKNHTYTNGRLFCPGHIGAIRRSNYESQLSIVWRQRV